MSDRASVEEIVAMQRRYFSTGETLSLEFRRQKLDALKEGIVRHETNLFDALRKDLGKSEFEAFVSEVGMVLKETRFARKRLRSWMKPRRTGSILVAFPASNRIHFEPYGVTGILSPWNFPFQLAIAPLVAAISAGNTAVVKPSEFAPHTAKAIEAFIGDTFEPQYVAAVLGESDVGQAICEQPLDLLYFCGSPAVGKQVMRQAAERLTPVILELGGKNPCIVSGDADIPIAARRIIWGKFLNCGQACVAPDYVVVERRAKDRLIQACQACIEEFWGTDPQQSPDYPRIINQRHFEHLAALLESSEILCGGEMDIDDLYMAPTLVDNVSWSDEVMSDEIFGPILPIIAYDDPGDAIEKIREMPSPLALYIFSRDRGFQKRVTETIGFGGGCINDTVLHYVNPHLPFGGKGQSGIGAYHGRAGFVAFSHRKSLMKRSTLLDFRLRYPPFGKKLKLVKKLF